MITLAHKILEELLKIEIRYKGGTKASFQNLFGTISGNKKSFRSSVNRLYKKGFISKDGAEWVISKSGKEYLESNNLKSFESPFVKGAKKDLLLMFDVPEECRHYRNWLRDQLKEFGYTMVQQSVWVGPSPLPKEFKDYIKELKLQKNIKTFKLAKALSIK